MRFISELQETIQNQLGWNKARVVCLTGMLVALFMTRTVNLMKLACAFDSPADQLSRYRRLQRFFSGFTFDYDQIAFLLFSFFFKPNDSIYLTMDRTNWQWGKKSINILMLAAVYKGSAIPLYWVLLDKKGNSNTDERIQLLEKFIDQFGKTTIKGLLADREFIGEKWFKWLLSENIPFYIRLKNNTITTNSRGKSVDIDGLFYSTPFNQQRVLRGKRWVWGTHVFLAGLRLQSGELLIIATSEYPHKAIDTYRLRWEIEILFGCLKTRGFCFEDTRITHQDRIKKLLVLLSIAYAWSCKTGEWQQTIKPIKVKKHGRLAVSLFRYGLDYLANAFFKQRSKPSLIKKCCQLFKENFQLYDKKLLKKESIS